MDHRSGGVSGDSMMRKDAGERREISLDGGKTSGNRTMSQAAKADAVQGEVGRPRSSEEASVMGAERRGSSCVRAKEASGERGDDDLFVLSS